MKISSPFTGGSVEIKTRTEEIKYRGVMVKIRRRYYHCVDTGHNFTDAKLDDEMMAEVRKEYQRITGLDPLKERH